MFDTLLVQWAALSGFGALIAFLINVLKTFGIVKTDQAPAWSAALNIIGLAALLITGLVVPDLDIPALDAQVAEFVQVGIVLFSYIIQLLGSKLGHAVVVGTPVIGKRLT